MVTPEVTVAVTVVKISVVIAGSVVAGIDEAGAVDPLMTVTGIVEAGTVLAG